MAGHAFIVGEPDWKSVLLSPSDLVSHPPPPLPLLSLSRRALLQTRSHGARASRHTELARSTDLQLQRKVAWRERLEVKDNRERERERLKK